MFENWDSYQILILLVLISLLIGAVSFFAIKSKKTIPTSDEPTLPEPSFQNILGRRICYYISNKNKKQTLVFLHGIGASSYTWRHQYFDLSKKFNVILLDLAGFGKSDKDLIHKYDLDSHSKIVEEFLYHLDLGPCVLVGSSMGGAIALDVCRRKPDLVSKLIVLAPAVQPNRIPPAVTKLQGFGSVFGALLNSKTMEIILKMVLANPNRVNSSTVENYLLPYRENKNSVHTFIKSTATLRDKRLPQLFLNLGVKTLILYGEKDAMVKLKSVERLKSLTGADLKTHKDLGHHLHEDDFEWTNHEIREFIQSKT